MKDMVPAVERLRKAIKQKEKVLLYGDYDVDGTTCVAMLYSFLENRHKKLDYYIPDRYKEGYGVSMEGIDYAHQNGYSLIIAMDCGIQAREQVARAKSQGIDFIICDHHHAEGGLPEAVAILDPKRPDCNYPYKELSGCGVVFKMLQAYLASGNEPFSELIDYLDLLVLSIASDIVPITGENRILAFHGLEKLNNTSRKGLLALIEVSGRKLPLSIGDLVFGLGPHLNAAGRMADAHQAVRLLLSNDKFVAADNARILGQRNNQRKEFDKMIAEEAKVLFEALPGWENLYSIVLFNPNWHKGIVGIAASRMVERYHRPSILLTESNGSAVGSARSIPGFNVLQSIKQCSELLDKFGGHDHAAGLSLPVHSVPEFATRFEQVVRNSMPEELLHPEIKVSSVLDFKDINLNFWKILKQFEPFGPGNRSPVFVTKNVTDTGESRLLKGNHLQLHVRQKDGGTAKAIGFDMGHAFDRVKEKRPFHIAYKIDEDTWQGKSSLKLYLKDIWI
jgi:single-stranded-DNA-specific exonuclease